MYDDMADTPNFDEFMRLLAEHDGVNGPMATVDVLLHCTCNIVDHPEEPKYRRLKIASRDVTERLLPVQGALECLFLAGFQESTEYLVYPQGASIEPLRRLRDELLKLRHELTLKFGRNPVPSTAGVNLSTTNTSWDTKQYRYGSYPSNIYELEDEFYQKIQSSCRLVELYENELLQKKARSVIPMASLHKVALDKHRNNAITVGLTDCLLVELLAWFKRDFFSWFHVTDCPKCASPMTSMGHVEPSVEELRWGGSRVEGYGCAGCETSARFPRYNDPAKLLETRTGRCGEWANCFTLCCVSMGMNARYVLDWTDHVWTEVYSDTQARWLHCDPCENVCDTPLVYESGWKKDLTYVIAFAKNDIQDVTWRYSSRHAEVLSRRLLCRETWLLQTICTTRNELQANLDQLTKTELTRRLIVELVEFLCPRRAVNDDETVGRTSGSLDWRLARGDTQDCSVQAAASLYTFELNDDEVASKTFHLKYCSSTDIYHRMCCSSTLHLQSWLNGVHSVTNMFRKVESDWKRVYLARTEGSDVGRISWKVVVDADKNLTVKTISVTCDSDVFENGMVIWKICARDKCIRVPNDGVPFVTDALSGEREVTLEAELSGGCGSSGWQHAQLFRQSLKDTDKFPLEVFLTFD